MSFSRVIIDWYQHHKRDLPWRKTRDPYIIWLSEIIMQQTRVEQGLPYFERFASKYPSVNELASADQGEILREWQGLGYYSRGRNLHHTARKVMDEFGGYFPTSFNSLLKLKGIGEYTAAAISSFAADEPRAVVDGNVFRLLSRFYGIETPINSSEGKARFTDLANSLLDPTQSGTFNQAIMEFGSLQCRPKNPLCQTCPLQSDCVAYSTGKVEVLPVKIKAKSARKRFFNYFLIIKNGQVLMQQRMGSDIWSNLYQPPLFESTEELAPENLISHPDFTSRFGKDVTIARIYEPVKHILSHQVLHSRFYKLENFSEQIALENGSKYVDFEELEQLAKPKLIFDFFNKIFKLNNHL